MEGGEASAGVECFASVTEESNAALSKPCLFVGQASRDPASSCCNECESESQGDGVLGGAAGRRLVRLSGLENLFDVCDKMNVVNFFPGRKKRHREGDEEYRKVHNGKGDKFPMDLARKTVAAFDCSLSRYKLIVLLGLQVAKAFRLSKPALFKSYERRHESGMTRLIIFPHVSGVSHYWNSKERRRRAALELRKALRMAGVKLELELEPTFAVHSPFFKRKRKRPATSSPQQKN